MSGRGVIIVRERGIYVGEKGDKCKGRRGVINVRKRGDECEREVINVGEWSDKCKREGNKYKGEG